MKILIISEHFAPENTVAAIRMSKIAKYLHEITNATIDVLTRKKDFKTNNEYDLSFVNKFIFVEEGLMSKKMISLYKKYSSSDYYNNNRKQEISIINDCMEEKATVKSRISFFLRSILAVAWSEFSANAYAMNAYKHLKHIDYDCVISSFGPESSQYIGRYIKHKKSNVIWIADYRDPLYSGEATKGLLALWAKSFPRRITKKADAITTVSYGFVNSLGIDNNKNVYVITNGFDSADLFDIDIKEIRHNKMNLVYVGSLLVGRRDITPVIKAISELIEEGKIDCKKVMLSYAGADWKEFNSQISDLSSRIEIVNFLKRKLSNLN